MAKTLLDWALEYHDAGLCVIPLKPGEKKPNLPSWESYQSSRPTRKKVESWFKDGKSNIGIICGAISGNLVVVDFDDITKYEAVRDKLPDTWTVKTSRGMHVYLRTDEPVKSFKQEHIDFQGEGKYVVAPPSVHPEGGKYKFTHHTGGIATTPSLSSLGLVKMPESTQPKEREPNWVTKAMAGPVLEGSRDDTCTRLAGHFLRLLPRDEVELILTNWGMNNCDPPFEEEQVIKCIDSIDKKRGPLEDLVAVRLGDIIAQDLPEIPEFINNWLRAGDFTLLVGGGGVGKSTIALPATMALSSGQEFIGFSVPTPERALYLDLEMGPFEFQMRAKTLAESYEKLALENFYGISLSNFRINKEGNLARLRRLIETVEPRLLVVDNHARFHTGDPNAERDMMDMVVVPCTEIMEDYNLAILYLMHTPWKERDRPRGTMCIFDAASTVISVEKGGSGDRNRILKWSKNRPARREERVESMTILYDPTTFFLERADDAGIEDDVLQNIQWPIGTSALEKILRGRTNLGHNSAINKIKNMVNAGDLVRTDDNKLDRPGRLPDIEPTVPLTGDDE